jgi:BON domain-containing protein
MVGFEFSVGILEPFDCRRQPAFDESQFEAERLAAKIEQAVWHATAAAVKDLCVELRDGDVILTGRCLTYYTKQIAQHATMGTAVGWNVVNQITVT